MNGDAITYCTDILIFHLVHLAQHALCVVYCAQWCRENPKNMTTLISSSMSLTTVDSKSLYLCYQLFHNLRYLGVKLKWPAEDWLNPFHTFHFYTAL